MTIRCEACGRDDVARIAEVGDAWLDAGIVHFSTLGWHNETWVERRERDGRRGRADRRRPSRPRVLGEVVPGRLGHRRSREQIRLWFYSQSFMAVTLEGRSPYRAVLAYERMRDEHGEEMHKSKGNAIAANEALELMGADVMRWIFCRAGPEPEHQLRLRAGRRGEAAAAHVLELGLVLRHVRERRRLRPGRPSRGELKPLDRWLVARTAQLVRDATERTTATGRPASCRRSTGSSTISRTGTSGARAGASGKATQTALRVAVGCAHGRAAGDLAGDAVPRRAPLARPRLATEESVFLAPLAGGGRVDETLLAEVAEVRRVVELGRQARAASGTEAAPAAAPPRRRGRRAVRAAHVDEIAEELRVKDVEFGEVEASELRVQAEPARARAEARGDAPRRPGRAPGGPLRASRGRQVPRRRPRARAGRGAASSASAARAGRWRPTTG